MRYPPSLLDEIRARLPVSSVVGKRVRLAKAGREWRGLSPFNAEKSPSFFVNDQKGFYHCFSSGKHGDIFAFVMETEGVAFPEAVERLAAEAGVALPAATAESQQVEERRKTLHDVLEMAAAFFEATLAGPDGTEARAYLNRRGMDARTQRAFRLGFATDGRHALRDHLARQGVAVDAMLEAGLLISHEEAATPYDRFRDRVMFPICDRRGRVIAFGGRAMSKEARAKYLNSSETPLFHKGRTLYNLHNARSAAADKRAVIAVEGYVDVIAMSSAGFPHTVAPLGTALTAEQLALLWQMADEPVLCFDGDGAGRRAAFRAIDTALPLLAPGKSLTFALLPEGQDPDDLARAGGQAAIAQVIGAAQPLVDMLWAREVEMMPLDTPERRAAFEERLRAAVGQIADERLRRHYGAEMLARLRALMPAPPVPARRYGDRQQRSQFESRSPSYQSSWSQDGSRAYRGGARNGNRSSPPFAQQGAPRISPALARHPMFSATGGESPREALIVMALLMHPMLLDSCETEFISLDMSGPMASALRAFLIDAMATGQPDREAIRNAIAARGQNAALDLLSRRVHPGDRWVLDSEAALDDVLRTLAQAMTLHRRARTLHKELRAAERALADDDSEANLAWLKDVQAQLLSVDGAEADSESR